MSRVILVVASLTVLSACGETLFEQTASGAAIGAGAAAVTGNNIATGAAVGAGAGVVSNAIR